MGSCCGKCKSKADHRGTPAGTNTSSEAAAAGHHQQSSPQARRSTPSENAPGSATQSRTHANVVISIAPPASENNSHESSSVPPAVVIKNVPQHLVDALVLETLSVIITLVDNEQEPPMSMVRLHAIADQESGWLQVVYALINVIPIDNPLGPANITLLLDDCPLPTRETIEQLTDRLDLSAQVSRNGRSDATRHRNIALVLGCLAEKLAGPRSLSLFTPGIMEYLLANLEADCHPSVILFSLVALEKFSETTENKLTVQKRLEHWCEAGGEHERVHPIVRLENNYLGTEDDFVLRQVGFCAQWSLDNLFLVEGRPLSYTLEDSESEKINAMLNANDVSEYLKIAPSGLEARCDVASFESVRCTFSVSSGCWYFEVLIVTSGIMQIGWATAASKFLNHDGYGIGDDEYSVAFDGCRKLIWHGAVSKPVVMKTWKPGDVLGALLDFETKEVIFTLNGDPAPTHTDVFSPIPGEVPKEQFFAAASFMSYQQCKFNFGAAPFVYPPQDRSFQSFNAHGQLSPKQRTILPRRIKLEKLASEVITKNACTLCYDRKGIYKLLPCDHEGFCFQCMINLKCCPMCRGSITEAVELDLSDDDDEEQEDHVISPN